MRCGDDLSEEPRDMRGDPVCKACPNFEICALAATMLDIVDMVEQKREQQRRQVEMN